MNYVLREVDCPKIIVEECGDGVFWSINKNGYLILSNVSESECEAMSRPGRANLWDCCEQKLLGNGDSKLTLAPHSFRMFRVVGRISKFFDVLGASNLESLIDGAGRAEIGLIAGRKTVLVLRASPREIMVDGKSSTITQEIVNDAYHVTLQQCPPGTRNIALKW